MNRILMVLPLVVAVTAAPLHAQNNPNSVEIEGYGTLHGIYIDDIRNKTPSMKIEYSKGEGGNTWMDIEVLFHSESYFDVNWWVTWVYSFEMSKTADMRDSVIANSRESSGHFELPPGDTIYLRVSAVRTIQDQHGGVRKDASLFSPVYKLEGFDFTKIDRPPKHEGPIKREVVERRVEETDEDGFVTID